MRYRARSAAPGAPAWSPTVRRSEDRRGRRTARRRRPRHQCPRREPHQRDAHESGADLRREPAPLDALVDGAAAARGLPGRAPSSTPCRRRSGGSELLGEMRREERGPRRGYAEYEPFIVDPERDGRHSSRPGPSTSTSCSRPWSRRPTAATWPPSPQVQSEQLQPLLQILADDLEAEGDAQSATGRASATPHAADERGQGHHPAARHRARLGRDRGRRSPWPRRPPAHAHGPFRAAWPPSHGRRRPDRRHGCAGRRRGRAHGRRAGPAQAQPARGPVVGGRARRTPSRRRRRSCRRPRRRSRPRPRRPRAQSGVVSSAAEEVCAQRADRRRGCGADGRLDPGDRVERRGGQRGRGPRGDRGGDHDRHGREAGRVLGRDRQRRQGDHEHRRADQPAGAERDDRGGAGR